MTTKIEDVEPTTTVEKKRRRVPCSGEELSVREVCGLTVKKEAVQHQTKMKVSQTLLCFLLLSEYILQNSCHICLKFIVKLNLEVLLCFFFFLL